ncbi:zinc ABC transporter substrate-binding protein [Rhodobacteraceae bacterium NNCM2]|nr:zinc ABC transporter substrate-binding protein [Coraliihabitans acroporae]
MRSLSVSLVILTSVMAGAAHAAPPKVATDIPPVHSLVAQVMGDLGTPELVMKPGVSPHGYSMRPSEAQLLESADLLVWVGDGLTPWLANAKSSLAPNTLSLELMAAPGMRLLEFREGARFEAHDHDHGHGDDHDEHDDHEKHDDHADHDKHDDHDDEHAEKNEEGHHDEHGHEGEHLDPHIWLDPENAKQALRLIADSLADLDPENAATYYRNATDSVAKLSELETWVNDKIAPVHGGKFIVFHDAYHYYEARFDIEASGAISLSDASAPSPRRVAEVRDTILDVDARCVFAEPQFNTSIIASVTEGTDVKQAILDPLGAGIEPGPGLYNQLIQELTINLSTCLTPES